MQIVQYVFGRRAVCLSTTSISGKSMCLCSFTSAILKYKCTSHYSPNSLLAASTQKSTLELCELRVQFQNAQEILGITLMVPTTFDEDFSQLQMLLPAHVRTRWSRIFNKHVSGLWGMSSPGPVFRSCSAHILCSDGPIPLSSVPCIAIITNLAMVAISDYIDTCKLAFSII
jgi:hypothetical protein